MENQEQQYKKGFNAGYLLSKNEPELLKQLLSNPNNQNEYFEGLVLGQKQFDREQLLAQVKQSQQSKEKGREL